MKVASITDVKAHFSAYLKWSQEGLVVVTRNGKPSAVILGITDEDEIERLSLAYSPKFNRILETARREIRKGKGIPHDEFWAEMDDRARSGRLGMSREAPPPEAGAAFRRKGL